MPAAAREASRPVRPRSTTVTEKPVRFSSRAARRPTTPAPTTMTSCLRVIEAVIPGFPRGKYIEKARSLRRPAAGLSLGGILGPADLPQHLGQGEFHVLRDACRLLRGVAAPLLEALHHVLYQHFRRGSPGGHRHGLLAVEPFSAHVLRSVDEVGGRSFALGELAQAVGVRAV